MKTQIVKIPSGKSEIELSGVLSAPDEKALDDFKQTLVIMTHDIPFSHSLDHDNLYPFLRTIFDDHGLQTLMFDFESCGDSDGNEEDFTLQAARNDLQSVLKWAKDKGFEHFIFVAAGVSAALCLEITDKTTRAVFLFWPVVDIAAYAARMFAEGSRSIAGRIISPAMISDMNAYVPTQAMKSLKLPILIQYGANDDAVSAEQIELIKAHFNALRIDITSYTDGGHGLLDPKHRKMASHHIRQFLHKYA